MSVSSKKKRRKKSGKNRSQSKGSIHRTLLLAFAAILGFLVVSNMPGNGSGNASERSAADPGTKPAVQDSKSDNANQDKGDDAKPDGDSKPADGDQKDDDKKSDDESDDDGAGDADDDAPAETPAPTYEQQVERYASLHKANAEIQKSLTENKKVPSQAEGEKLVKDIKDFWDRPVKYSFNEGEDKESDQDDTYSIITAGPDGKLGTGEEGDTSGKDDITLGPFGVPDWQQSVDTWFGNYLVTPMVTVLWFDFFTGPEAHPDANFDGENDHSWTTAVYNLRQTLNIPSKGFFGTAVPFVVAWLLLGGLFFTIRMTFINVRGFWHAIRLTKGDFDDDTSEGDVSHFQALSAALSATVGLGNIAGVALAISAGGPGATFWMVIIGLIGMSSKFTECTLGQMYRKVDENGRISGGPMHYLRDGLADMGLKPLGIFLAFFFSVLCIGGSLGGGNTFQVVQSLGALRTDPNLSFLDTYPWIYGIVMVLMVGAVIIGGIKVIGKVAGGIVPFMCGIYVICAIIILGLNVGDIPNAIGSIFSQAFKPAAVYGGFLGVLVIGITRAVFSNEAGTGSAAIAHSAAKTDIPVKEGIVALLEPFIDTVVVCTMTALVIIITGAYSDPETAGLRAGGNGAGLTAYAFANGGHEFMKYFLYAAVFLFAFSTCISWSYYGERCWTHWFGQKSSMVYKILFLVFTFLGSIVSAANIQAFSDIIILSMALPNILGVLLLSGKVRRHLDDYWNRVQSGEIQSKK